MKERKATFKPGDLLIFRDGMPRNMAERGR